MNSRKERLEVLRNIDIYPVISSEFCAGRTPLFVLEQVAIGGTRIVQLREKNSSKQEISYMCREFRKVCDSHGMLLIMNDHVDIALECGADGVHLGQEDMPLQEARNLAPDLILGCSTHSEREALAAQEDGADYVNIGPIFATQTKKTAYQPLGLEVLRQVPPLLKIPFTVMGGIKEQHIPELAAIGARRIAMVTEITTAQNIPDKVRKLICLIRGGQELI